MFNRTAATLFLTIAACGSSISAQTPSVSLEEGATKAQAFWIDRTTVLLPTSQVQPGGTYKIFSDPNAHLAISKTGLSGKYSVALHLGETLTEGQLKRFPQLAHGYTKLLFPAGMTETVQHMLLKGQLALSVQKADGSLSYLTGIQTPGVLDDLYAYSGQLGVLIHRNTADGDDEWKDFPDDATGALKVKVWAPTAQSLTLQLFATADLQVPSQTVPMHEHNGVWVAVLDARWIGCYYLLDEKVYSRAQLGIVENVVTDPYSIDISLNGSKSRLLDINSPASKPEGWDADHSPSLRTISDLSIYELHVRDFSIADQTVPASHRGTYLAFTDTNSDGMKHLQALAIAGLKVVHFLPTFHFSGVDEDKTKWKTSPDLTHSPPDGYKQEAAISAIKNSDGYNWGYGPIHFLAPEGSYAVNPEVRVREYRSMVMALHKAGLRVVQDVVFNHTSGTGQGPDSVLDKVVPGYYNRFDADGNLYTATCCADTASEHLMMGKLQQDTILWAVKHYKIDGFRFDLMGFTFVDNLRKIRAALDSLSMAKDGVDGSKIYLYGEGWEFGEIAKNAFGVSATQRNLYGVGVGSFNDRLRDGVRGGTVTTDPRPQGFATGMLTDSSKYTSSISTTEQRHTLLHQQDLIKLGLAGNLRDFSFTDSQGAKVTGSQVSYSGRAAGYAASPSETINYVSAHDNPILFDAIQLKASLADDAPTRARRQVLAMSIVALGEGVPFFVAGDDLLRSKDMDSNSYNSGDWFNKIDWTGQGNNWGIGLPISGRGEDEWSIERPLLAKASLKPTPSTIQLTSAVFQELLRIRYSSDLFRMATLGEIQEHLHFLDTDVPGLIVMQLDADDEAYGPYRHLLVIFNATTAKQIYAAEALKGKHFSLHPVQAQSADEQVRSANFDTATGRASVPALTTAVFTAKE